MACTDRQPEPEGANPVSPVTARMHALLARELIAACGGLDEAAGACRLKKSRLSECCQAQAPEPDGPNAYLPIDVVAELEAYCGRPIYSQALVDARPSAPGERLVDEACDVAEGAAALQHLVRRLEAEKRPLTPREKTVIDAAVLKLERELSDVRATVDLERRP